jgi:hypothetical protein
MFEFDTEYFKMNRINPSTENQKITQEYRTRQKSKFTML